MHYSNDYLQKMYAKMEYNQLYKQYYMEMYDKYKHKKYFNRSDRISSCLDLWVWDKYEKNKLLDLKKVNRCYNNRFCPNCKTLDAAKFIHYINPQIQNVISLGYVPFILTLTVPNVTSVELKDYLTKITSTFRKFFEKFNTDNPKYAFRQRLCKIYGALRTLEITHNAFNDTYHPHIHVLIFLKDFDDNDLRKVVKGRYSYKNNECNQHSFFEIQLMKVWSMMFNKISVSEKNYNLHPDDPCADGNLVVDLRPLDEDGIYELIKYTVKDVDLSDYKVFETFVISLENRRIRQTYGNLLDFDEEDFDVGEYQELELQIEENPEQIIVQDITDLYTTYKEYVKISRFQPNIDIAEASNNLK